MQGDLISQLLIFLNWSSHADKDGCLPCLQEHILLRYTQIDPYLLTSKEGDIFGEVESYSLPAFPRPSLAACR